MNIHVSSDLDPRLNAFRDDLADIRLKGRVEAPRFVPGTLSRVKSHFVDVHAEPDAKSGLQTQFLHGHDVLVFDDNSGSGWLWVQGQTDGYVGYVLREHLQPVEGGEINETTHMVSVPRTFVYREADLKSPRCGYRSIGSKLTIVGHQTVRGTDYAMLESGGAVIDAHLVKLGDWLDDPVAVAGMLMHTPYLWGGCSGFGVDCSGLVSLAHMLCGRQVLRDSDMQAESLGRPITKGVDRLQRGDLVFWKAHVGMMADEENLLHSNGKSMDVRLEPLADAIRRIDFLYGQPTIMRRP